jgi:integrase
MPTEVRVSGSDEQAAVESEVLRVLRGGRPDRAARLKRVRKVGALASHLQQQSGLIKRRTNYFCDGAGLWLVVSPGEEPDSVRRSWIFRWTVSGQSVISKTGKARRLQRRIGLGSLTTVNLERARELADGCRRLLQDGQDPLLVKRGRAAAVRVEELRLRTLRAAVEQYFRDHSSAWKSLKYAQDWRQSFEQHLKSLMDLPVSAIDRAMLVDALKPLWDAHPETGQRLRGRLEQVLAAATAREWRSGDNPASWVGLKHSFRPRSELQPVKRHNHLDPKDAPDFMRRLRDIDGITARALELLILTAVRTGEVLSATGEEFDLDSDKPIWTVPAEHTKTGKKTGEAHEVPLSDAAIACLRKVKIVPGQKVFPVHDRALYRLAKEIERGVSVHGFRATFSTWAGDLEYPREVTEAALDHQVGNAVERAYRRTKLLAQRHTLLRDWANYLDGASPADNVVPMRAGR